jgi:ankyrin repeat protein
MGGLRRLSRLDLVVMMLLQATKSGDVVEVQRLVATGVNVDERDANGATALHWASCNGHVDVMMALVELSADKDAKDADGDTPLHVAAAYGHVEAIKALE